MLSRAARNQVERILEYISSQEQKTCWRGTAELADNLRTAWWTVWFAAYQQDPNPYQSALRKILGPRYRTYIETHNTLPLVNTVQDAGEPDDVDGRNGSQWVRSVLAYLDWRSGDCWRRMADRNHPERRTYTNASLMLRQAFYRTPPRAPQPQDKVKAKARSQVA